MADAADSKSAGRKPVKVRLLSPAPVFMQSRERGSFGRGLANVLFEKTLNQGRRSAEAGCLPG